MAKNLVSLIDLSAPDDDTDERVWSHVDRYTDRSRRAVSVAVGTRRAVRQGTGVRFKTVRPYADKGVTR